jgi:hypothetical protein
MKKIKFIIYFFFIIGTFTSCHKSDNLIDEVLDNVKKDGVFLRTVEQGNKPYLCINSPAPFTEHYITVQVQEGNGSFQPEFKEVRLYVTAYKPADFNNPILDNDAEILNPGGEKTLLMTVPASEFEPGEYDLPIHEFRFSGEQVMSLFPDDTFEPFIGNPEHPNYILILEFEIEMNDGRVFDKNTVGVNIAGTAYFNAPFQYKKRFLYR